MSVNKPSLPRQINLGSGKDFRADFFNIDIDPTWSPDAVIDLSSIESLESGVTVNTVRFGMVTLCPGQFRRIIANDVLEHVPNLVRLMTTCLDLLEIDGVFEVSVPYDLSFGAWQDPTHVRTFNERSWLYYTDWFWYLGWSEARFVLDALNFVPSPLGLELRNEGLPREQVLRTPRAIDSMSVRLRKVNLSNDDRRAWNHFRDRKGQLARQQVAATQPAIPAGNVQENGGQLTPFANGWSFHAHRHCIWVVSPDNYQHNQAFSEIAEVLQEAFAELGGSAPIARHPSEWNGRSPIILGGNLLSVVGSPQLPKDSILVNLEQVTAESTWLTGDYLTILKQHAVLDYSIRNKDALVRAGIAHARLLEIGYSPIITRIPAGAKKDIDVLFYGSINERRAKILNALKANGLNVVSLFGVYGGARDAEISRAKIVLNMHYYESAIFEVIRVSYLLANQVCVLSEGDAEDPDIRRFVGGIELVPYDLLVERCLELIRDPDRRDEIAQRGFRSMRASRQSDLLKQNFFPELLRSENSKPRP